MFWALFCLGRDLGVVSGRHDPAGQPPIDMFHDHILVQLRLCLFPGQRWSVFCLTGKVRKEGCAPWHPPLEGRDGITLSENVHTGNQLLVITHLQPSVGSTGSVRNQSWLHLTPEPLVACLIFHTSNLGIITGYFSKLQTAQNDLTLWVV